MFLVKLKKIIGDQKIDVLIDSGQQSKNIYKKLKKQGIETPRGRAPDLIGEESESVKDFLLSCSLTPSRLRREGMRSPDFNYDG